MVCVKAEVSGLDMCHSFACSVEGVAADLPTAAVMMQQLFITPCTVWFPLPICSDEMKLELAVVPTPDELTRTMQERSVFTMASSPPDHAVMKFFFYAQHVRASSTGDMSMYCRNT